MKSLSGLLKKYQQRLQPPQASVEKICLEVIKEVTGFEFEPAMITYIPSIKTLNLNTPSIVKQEIKLQAPKILTEVERRLGPANSPKVIR